jgi:hypothetical protein
VPGARCRWKVPSIQRCRPEVANLTDEHPKDWTVEHGRQEKRVLLKQAWISTTVRKRNNVYFLRYVNELTQRLYVTMRRRWATLHMGDQEWYDRSISGINAVHLVQ